MLKKVLSCCAGIILAVAELLLLGVSPLTTLSTLVLTVGYVALAMIVYTDYIEDRKFTKLALATYACWFIGVAFAGVGIVGNRVWPLLITAVCAVGAIVCHTLDKKEPVKLTKPEID